MPFIQEIFNPVIDPSRITCSAYNNINYINTIPYNIAVLSSAFLICVLFWFFYGLGRGKSRTIRLSHGNYYLFWVFFLIQLFVTIFFLWFPIIFKIFE